MTRHTLAIALAFLGSAGIPADAGKKAPADYKLFEKKLAKDQQILHALDRITFGPRPGDLEVVKKLGLQKWIDQQLHPEKLTENPELTAKLEPLESLKMSQEEAIRMYPPPRSEEH